MKDKTQIKKRYESNYASVLHHILDMHENGTLTSNQYWYAFDQIKGTIKEEKK